MIFSTTFCTDSLPPRRCRLRTRNTSSTDVTEFSRRATSSHRTDISTTPLLLLSRVVVISTPETWTLRKRTTGRPLSSPTKTLFSTCFVSVVNLFIMVFLRPNASVSLVGLTCLIKVSDSSPDILKGYMKKNTWQTNYR